MNMPTIPTVHNTIDTQAIVDAVRANGFKALDDHHSNRKEVQLDGVAVLWRDEKQTVVALFTKTFSDYYTINEIRVDEEGIPHVTRNACGGTIFNATDDVHADVKANRAGYDWAMIEKMPALHPGWLVNIVTPKDEYNDFIGTEMYVEHALSGLQLRINTSKHIDSGIATLDSEEFRSRLDIVKGLKESWETEPTKAKAVLLKKACEEARCLL